MHSARACGMAVTQIDLLDLQSTAANNHPCTGMEAEGEGNDWQRRLFDEIMTEREANDRLKREDPAAYEAKMRAQLPTSKCCLCGETFKGYGHNAHPVRHVQQVIVLPQHPLLPRSQPASSPTRM